MRSFLLGLGFTELHTPKLMGSASESGAEVFRVDYFGSSAYLAQSPQLYKQMAIAAGFDRVMEVGPVFRAEPSFTSRHSTEFTGLDLEMAWIDSVDDVMRMEEELLADAIAGVRDALGRQIEEVFGTDLVVPTTPFPRMTHAEARERLLRAGWRPGNPASADLDGEGERLLSKLVADELGHQFVFVTDYPASVRPFYHLRPAGDPTVTSSFDLIWNGLEVTTGAQREHRYDVLVAQAAEQGIALEPISDYVNVEPTARGTRLPVSVGGGSMRVSAAPDVVGGRLSFAPTLRRRGPCFRSRKAPGFGSGYRKRLGRTPPVPSRAGANVDRSRHSWSAAARAHPALTARVGPCVPGG
jgi:aspartyl-tRNA synthetase